MSIEFEPAPELHGATFSPPLDLNLTIDYQIHLINHCIKWLKALKDLEEYRAIPRINAQLIRALKQIDHLQMQIKIETEIESNEEDTSEDIEGN